MGISNPYIQQTYYNINLPEFKGVNTKQFKAASKSVTQLADFLGNRDGKVSLEEMRKTSDLLRNAWSNSFHSGDSSKALYYGSLASTANSMSTLMLRFKSPSINVIR